MPTKTSNVARVNGIELGYQIVGEGKPVVLLHGGFGSVEMFGPNVELLAAKNQVIGVDLQSHGRSPAADRPKMPVMLVIGDADGIPPSHAVEFFELLGGGKRDASWDRSGMTHHRLAILPGLTHYDINVAPALSAAVIPFRDGV